MDRIYTPPYLAASMAKAACTQPSADAEFVVADFTAGAGELLNAAQTVWPTATIVATDIDSRAVRALRKKRDGWRTGVCDFLNPRSRHNSPLLRTLIGNTNLVLLNPPFSCRGGTRVSAKIDGVTLKCSTGLAFVVNSVDYLIEGGELIAVLPEGSLTSEKDAATWDLLHSMGDIQVLRANGTRTFPRTVVRSVVVRFQKQSSHIAIVEPSTPKSQDAASQKLYPRVRIVRGTTMVHEIDWSLEDGDSVAFLHSTHLQNFTIPSHLMVRRSLGRCAVGPMVLLPRVGQPKQSKVAQYLGRKRFMLSDCVIALTCHSSEAAELLWNDLQANWSLLEQEYVGSGARYITNRRLSEFLLRLGYFPLIGTSKDYRIQKGVTENGHQSKPAP